MAKWNRSTPVSSETPDPPGWSASRGIHVIALRGREALETVSCCEPVPLGIPVTTKLSTAVCLYPLGMHCVLRFITMYSSHCWMLLAPVIPWAGEILKSLEVRLGSCCLLGDVTWFTRSFLRIA